MTAPFIVTPAQGTINGGTGGTTPPMYTGWQPDDIAITVIESDQVTVAAPAGVQHIPGSPITGAFARTNVFWRRLVAGSAAIAYADPGSDHVAAVHFGVRGCVTTGNPWDVITTGFATANPVVLAGFTTTVADALILMIVGHGLDTTNPQFSGWTNSSLTGVAEFVDLSGDFGNGGGVGVGSGVKAAAGVVGSSSVSFAGGAVGNKCWMHIALKPAVVAAGDPFSYQYLG